MDFLVQFTHEELDSVLRKIENRKAAGLDEILPELWKTRVFDETLLRHSNAVYNQSTIDRLTKWCILPFPKKGYFGLAMNYKGITITSIDYIRNRIKPKIQKILTKNENGFRRNRSITSQIMTIRRIIACVRAKKLKTTILIVDYSKAFDSIPRGRWRKYYSLTGYPKKTSHR